MRFLFYFSILFLFACRSNSIDKHLSDKEKAGINQLYEKAYSFHETDLDSTRFYLEILSQASKKSACNSGIANYFYLLSVVESMSGNFDIAFDCIKKALDIYLESNNQKRIADSYMILGNVYYNSHSLKEANYFWNKAYEEYIAHGIQAGIGSGYRRFGVELIDEDNERAFEYLRKAKAIFRETGKGRWISYVFRDLSSCYISVGESQTALNYIDSCISIQEQINAKLRLPDSYIRKALLLLKQDNKTVDSLFNKAITLATKCKSPSVMADTYSQMGQKEFKYGRYKSSVKWARKALGVAQSYNLSLVESESYHNLLDSYRQLNEQDSVSLYLDKYLNSRDLLDRNRGKSSLVSLNLHDEFIRKMEQKEILFNKKRLRFYSIIVFILLVFSIVILLYRVRVLKSDAEKRKLAFRLDKKNRELTTTLLMQVKNSELIDYLSTELKALRKDLKDDGWIMVNDILNNLKSSHSSGSMDEFKIYFEEVHPEFYTNLLKDFPKLTSNEKRLCAFLKLDMATREIASITQQSVHSITVARTRLRKKLNLTSSEMSLHTFLGRY